MLFSVFPHRFLPFLICSDALAENLGGRKVLLGMESYSCNLRAVGLKKIPFDFSLHVFSGVFYPSEKERPVSFPVLRNFELSFFSTANAKITRRP